MFETKSESRFQPSQVLVLYENGRDKKLLKHALDLEGSGFVLGAGCEVSLPAIRKVLKSIMPKNKKKSTRNILPEHILYDDGDLLLWWRPAQMRKMYIKDSDIKSANVQYPPLIFSYNNGSIKVFALAENIRPVEETELYCAPFPNCYGNGYVCWGNTDLGSRLNGSDNYIELIENCFFNSYFTHNAVRAKTINYPTGAMEYWLKEMAVPSINGFCSELLVKPVGELLTVRNLFEVS